MLRTLSATGLARSGVAVAVAARTVVAMILEAPWLEDDEEWETTEATVAELRPGWYCHTQEHTGFVRVCSITILPSTRGRMVFVDLADGRTLALEETTSVFVRRRRA
jgi:hypothetical protein